MGVCWGAGFARHDKAQVKSLKILQAASGVREKSVAGRVQATPVFCIGPTALQMQDCADRIHPRHHSILRLGLQTVVGKQFWKLTQSSKVCAIRDEVNNSTPLKNGSDVRKTTQPKTDIVVTVVRMVVVAIRGARVV